MQPFLDNPPTTMSEFADRREQALRVSVPELLPDIEEALTILSGRINQRPDMLIAPGMPARNRLENFLSRLRQVLESGEMSYRQYLEIGEVYKSVSVYFTIRSRMDERNSLKNRRLQTEALRHLQILARDYLTRGRVA